MTVVNPLAKALSLRRTDVLSAGLRPHKAEVGRVNAVGPGPSVHAAGDDVERGRGT